MNSQAVRRLHPQAYDALLEALSTYYWYKRDFSRLLLSLFEDQPQLLAGLNPTNAPKRETASEIIRRLQRNETHLQELTLQVLVTLSQFDESFPHLARLDDADAKVKAARSALSAVRAVTADYRENLTDHQAHEAELRAAATEAQRSRVLASELTRLRDTFVRLSALPDASARGLALESFLTDLFTVFDLDPRSAFKITGEQIDGAFTFDTDDYLLEARWRTKPSDPAQVHAFSGKVAGKTHRTSGIMLSINGFTPAARNAFKGRGTRLLLIDGMDLMAVLDRRIALDELLLRKRRHAAETGDPYLSVNDMLTAQ